MNFDKPIAWIDVESSGLDPQADAIWEYGFTLMGIDGNLKSGFKRFKPWKEIPPEICEKCKVTNEELAHEPPISEFMPKILASLRGKHIGGYNLRSLDLPLLDAEARRCGLKLEIDGLIFDSFTIFRQKHTRTLLDAIRIYCGQHAANDFEAFAHNAGHDALQSANVFRGQLAVHEDLAAMSLPELAAYCLGADDGREYLDWAGKLYRDKEGDVRFSFGGHRDERVADNKPYCNWMLSPKASFPESTLEALSTEMNRLGVK